MEAFKLRPGNGNQIVHVGYAKLIWSMLVFFKYAHMNIQYKCTFFSFRTLSLRCLQKTKTGFDLTARDSYFTILVEVFTNHILPVNTYFTNRREWTEHKIIVLKPASKYKAIWQRYFFRNILSSISSIIYLSVEQKCFVKIIFYGRVNIKSQIRDNYLLFHILWRQKSIS